MALLAGEADTLAWVHMKTRIMYIESKEDGVSGSARIGRVSFSQTGKSVRYQGRLFATLKGQGFKANYVDAESGAEY